MAFCSVDGQMITLGDYLQPYCVQSTTKTITYCIATEENGEDKVHQHVGREPSGITFNSMMYSCGIYDFSGDYAFSVGLPAKSGVSGAIAIPNVGSFAIFSPRLDPNHNSVRGVEFSKRLIEKFSFHNYDHITHCDKINPVENRIAVESI